MDIFIEVSKGSNIKYEYDKEKGTLFVDRFLHNTNRFPYNYGFLPGIMSPDGDDLDVIVMCEYSINPGVFIKCKIIGGIYVTDEKGVDNKLLAVPIDSIYHKSVHINNVTDINPAVIDDIIYFLSRYKDGEKGKFIEVGKTFDKFTALEMISNYKNKYHK